jgi:hypothetical protein
MKNAFSVTIIFLGVVSFLDAIPFLETNLVDTQTDPLGLVINGLTTYERNLEAKYEIESSPGPDFLVYRIEGGVPTPEIGDDRLLELNTFKASQQVIWNAKAFHLRSTEKNNGITIERQRLLSSDGLLVDYYPERPSAYIRLPDHVSSQFSLVELLGMLPSGLNSLKNPVRPDGWKTFIELSPSMVESGSLARTESGYTLTFFKKFEEFSGGTGFAYELSFQESEGMIKLTSIEVAMADGDNPQESSYRRPVWRTELLDLNANGFPARTHTRIWRYRKNTETNVYRQYLVREVKCSIQSIGFADADYDFSLDFDVGTFVTDEMTGSKYRVGNPLGSLMEEVAK